MNNQPSQLVILGESGVGKSSLVLRHVKQDQWNGDVDLATHEPTILETFTNSIGANGEKILIVDIGGSDQWDFLQNEWIEGAGCVVVVYSTADRRSLESAAQYHLQILDIWKKKCVVPEPPIALVGTKCDLVGSRQVSFKKGQAFAKKYGWHFYETSAKSGQQVSKLFHSMAHVMIRQQSVAEALLIKQQAKMEMLVSTSHKSNPCWAKKLTHWFKSPPKVRHDSPTGLDRRNVMTMVQRWHENSMGFTNNSMGFEIAQIYQMLMDHVREDTDIVLNRETAAWIQSEFRRLVDKRIFSPTARHFRGWSEQPAEANGILYRHRDMLPQYSERHTYDYSEYPPHFYDQLGVGRGSPCDLKAT